MSADQFYYSWRARRALSFVVHVANHRARLMIDQWHDISFDSDVVPCFRVSSQGRLIVPTA